MDIEEEIAALKRIKNFWEEKGPQVKCYNQYFTVKREFERVIEIFCTICNKGLNYISLDSLDEKDIELGVLDLWLGKNCTYCKHYHLGILNDEDLYVYPINIKHLL